MVDLIGVPQHIARRNKVIFFAVFQVSFFDFPFLTVQSLQSLLPKFAFLSGFFQFPADLLTARVFFACFGNQKSMPGVTQHVKECNMILVSQKGLVLVLAVDLHQERRQHLEHTQTDQNAVHTTGASA